MPNQNETNRKSFITQLSEQEKIAFLKVLVALAS